MKRETVWSRLGRLLLWLVAFLLLILAGVAMLLGQTLPRQTGRLQLAGLQAPAEIGRDAMGVVTIRARSDVAQRSSASAPRRSPAGRSGGALEANE